MSTEDPGQESAFQEAQETLRKLAGREDSTDAEGARWLDRLRSSVGNLSSDGADGKSMWKDDVRFKWLVERIPAITFMASLEGNAPELYVSPQIESVLGFSQSEWMENPILWYTQLHADDRERWQEEFARTCATGVNFSSQYRFISRDGRLIWVQGDCQVIRDGMGRPFFLQGIAFDITQMKEAEAESQRMQQKLESLVEQRTAQLADANRALREENERKDQFLAVLAHELRNPLAPVTLAAQLLREPATGPEDRRWAQDMIERQVGQMTRLIDDLLDLSRISEGKIVLRKESVDLAGVVARAVEAARPVLAERKHQLTMTFPSEALRLEADALRLEQVVLNLVTNAAKYTEPGGQIRIVVERQGGEAVLRVADNGLGIPPEMLESIFELFTQVDQSLSRARQSGLGIGLALVRRLVHLHGGSIRATSAGRGRGSEFVVRLPLTAKDAASPPEVKTRPAAAGIAGLRRYQKVLVVDDQPDIARSLALLLNSWGYETSMAGEGTEAIASAMEMKPDVIMLDIGLPDMDGYELAAALRRRREFEDVLLVAISGYGRPEDQRRAHEAGFDVHITKPVEPAVLQRVLENPRLAARRAGGRR